MWSWMISVLGEWASEPASRSHFASLGHPGLHWYSHLVSQDWPVLVHGKAGAVACTCMCYMMGKGPVLSSHYDNGYICNTPAQSHSTMPTQILHPCNHNGHWDHIAMMTAMGHPVFLPFIHPNVSFASFWFTWLQLGYQRVLPWV